MLSGEFNAGELWKTTLGLISKKAILHALHRFFVHFLAVVLHDCNVKRPESSYLQGLWRKCRTFSCSLLFSLSFIFTLHWWPLAFLILLPLQPNFHVALPSKKCLLCFLSLALDLCRPFSRWTSLACLLLSLFLGLSLVLCSKFVDITTNRSLVL